MAMMTAGYALIFTADWERQRAALLMRERERMARAMTPVVELGPAPASLDEPGARECIVCMTRAVSTAAFPCKHSVLCDSCMRKVRRRSGQCPLCRGRIETVFRGMFEDEIANLDDAEIAIQELELQAHKDQQSKQKSPCGAWPQSLRWAMELCSPHGSPVER
mmetsp:Transcript_122610/g.354378  ORF Transcript_122610/g.354378 Transcript_122610/m.354378 type:complete len:163 (-) Transcript_122610:274-762(-)